LGVFENRVLSKIFGPEREEVGGGRGKSHKEELKKLYASPNIIRVTKSRSVRLARHIARMGEMRNVYKTLVIKPEGKRSLGRLRHRWEHNNRLDCMKKSWEVVDWIHLDQDREKLRAAVNTVMNFRVQ
jgi:hypothetical protein